MTGPGKIDTPVGKVSVRLQSGKLCAVTIGKGYPLREDNDEALYQRVVTELQAYFNDRQFSFSIPVDLQGTVFQQRVWRAMQRIPAGKTVTYGELAEKLHSSPRAVGNACRANPVPIIIPCHRVIAKQGIGGYDGQTGGNRLAIKRWLLRHEGVEID